MAGEPVILMLETGMFSAVNPALVKVPPVTVTEMLPLAALQGTVAVKTVPETAEKVTAETPPNCTAVSPVNAELNVMVTTVPGYADAGLNVLMPNGVA